MTSRPAATPAPAGVGLLFLPALLLLELLLLALELLFELELDFLEPPELDLVGMTLSSSGNAFNRFLGESATRRKDASSDKGLAPRDIRHVPLLFSTNKSDTDDSHRRGSAAAA